MYAVAVQVKVGDVEQAQQGAGKRGRASRLASTGFQGWLLDPRK